MKNQAITTKDVRFNDRWYRCTFYHRLIPWEGVEAYDWIDGHGFDQIPVKRPETLKALYARMLN